MLGRVFFGLGVGFGLGVRIVNDVEYADVLVVLCLVLTRLLILLYID